MSATEQKTVQALVLSTIRHGGKMIYPGDDETAVVIDLAQDDFDHLARFGAVTEVLEIDGIDETEDGGDGTPEPLTAEAIAEAIGQLGEDDFTESGPPKVSALEAALSQNITAAQRNDAWSLYQENQKPANTLQDAQD